MADSKGRFLERQTSATDRRPLPLRAAQPCTNSYSNQKVAEFHAEGAVKDRVVYILALPDPLPPDEFLAMHDPDEL
jgi:hypothetical protein